MNILIKLINDVKALCNTIISTANAIKAKTDTITANLFTSTHASRLDATISSRQASWGATSTHSSRIDASISSRALETTAQAIKAKTDTIQEKTTGRTFYEYQQLTTTASNNNSNYTTFKTITGQGRINYILFGQFNAFDMQVKILIDNVVAFEGLVTAESGTNSPCGIALFSFIHPVVSGSSSYFSVVVPIAPQKGSVKYFPSVSSAALYGRSWGTLISSGYKTGILFSNNPIEFKTSVVIQLSNPATTSGNVHMYSCYDLD